MVLTIDNIHYWDATFNLKGIIPLSNAFKKAKIGLSISSSQPNVK
jgi:hypothetical protein